MLYHDLHKNTFQSLSYIEKNYHDTEEKRLKYINDYMVKEFEFITENH